MQGKATGRRAPLGNQRSLAEGKSNGLGWVSKTSTHWKPCFQTLEAMLPSIGSNPSNHQKQNIIRWPSKYHPPGFETSSARRQSIIHPKWLFISKKRGKAPK